MRASGGVRVPKFAHADRVGEKEPNTRRTPKGLLILTSPSVDKGSVPMARCAVQADVIWPAQARDPF